MKRRKNLAKSTAFVAATAFVFTGAVSAQDADLPSYNLFGVPGLVEMPTATAAPDATLASTAAAIGESYRVTLDFQITPRLSGSFRYAALDQLGGNQTTLYDRSFDLRYVLLTETALRPAVAVGFQDLIGTGVYSAEYLVASKNFGNRLQASAGVGWGRLGSFQPFAETGTRPEDLLGEGGIPTYDRWFRGPVAAFGGLSYAVTDQVTLKAEYSSDAYEAETERAGFDRKTPWNFGIDYRLRSGTQLSLYSLHGTEYGAQVTLVTNPKTTGLAGGSEPAPLPVQPRDPNAVRDLGWTSDTARVQQAGASLAQLVAGEGMQIEALELDARRAVVRLRNPRYGAASQAIGRTARAMTRSLPASVEEFEIIPVINGVPMAAVILQRSDIERLEHDDAAEMLARIQMVDAFNRAPRAAPGLYPRFDWSLAPYIQVAVFDPDNPVRADTGIRATAETRLTPNLILSGSVAQKLGGNLDETTRIAESNLPRVRTNHAEYAREGNPAIEYLTAAHYGRLGKDLYSRVTLGYLESMYAGASAEVLWKPVGSRLAFGGEVNYVVRRDYDQLFGTQSMTTVEPRTGERRTIPNVNGHLSAYYDIGNGFHGQLDLGSYLAGDYGGTIAIDREFANGWKVGAYATFTNVSSEDFGEGSFDKGIRFSIPFASLTGQPSRRVNNIVVQSLTRDGGARLNVNGRLYETVRDYHQPEAAKSWGRFWR